MVRHADSHENLNRFRRACIHAGQSAVLEAHEKKRRETAWKKTKRLHRLTNQEKRTISEFGMHAKTDLVEF